TQHDVGRVDDVPLAVDLTRLRAVRTHRLTLSRNWEGSRWLLRRRQPARNSPQRYPALPGRVKTPPDGHGDVAHRFGDPGDAPVGRRGHVQAMLGQPPPDGYGEKLAPPLDTRPGDPERLRRPAAVAGRERRRHHLLGDLRVDRPGSHRGIGLV